jgi:heavy metal sensor kinase
MSLTTRLTGFFLAALALVLLGFSTTLYLLAQTYLYRQVDERLEAALQTLAAAAELEPEGIAWEPQERDLTLGGDADEGQARWVIFDDKGEVVDSSRNLESVDRLTACWTAPEGALIWDRESWRLCWRRVSASLRAGSWEGLHVPLPGEKKYKELILTAGISARPVQATLHNLALTLTLLSLGVWVLAALSSRALCRRALAPLTQMAVSARAMSAAHLDQRLPKPRTGDELADLGQAFNDLLGRVQEAYERQRQFTGQASHQLRTPLTALLGQVEVVLRRERPAEEYRQVLGVVRQQAEQLRQIVEMLLFLARADAEARLPQLEAVDLVAWLREHVQRWASHPRWPDFSMAFPDSRELPAKVHPPLLGQLVDNLLDNACKYSTAGTPIRLRLERAGAEAILTIEDGGCGIPEDELLQVFEPFYRSPSARIRGCTGVGLGLAVVRRIASCLGSNVQVESEPGQGSRFLVRLPLRD